MFIFIKFCLQKMDYLTFKKRKKDFLFKNLQFEFLHLEL